MTGVWVVLAVLAAATAFGLWRRATDGRVRDVPAPAAAVRAPAGGAPTPVPDDAAPVAVDSPDAAHHGGERLSAADLGGPLGERATLVQFSTAFCAPCRATHRVLDEIAGMVPGVAHVEIDAESHLDLVRRFDVLRTPTVLVLDRDGALRKRASGLPRKADVIAALGEVL